MKKVKQILAIIGIILLVTLYLLTFLCAIFDNTATMQYLTASVLATIFIPVMIWVYSYIFSKIHPKDDK